MATLRITAGVLRGRRLPVPPHDVRPTSERARQAYFNIVADRIAGARFLDLFAGSGIFSFEAVSRGASSAVALDSSRANVAAIVRQAGEWQVPVRAVVANIPEGIERAAADVHDLIYADPPYDYDRYDDLLTVLDTRTALAPDALVAVEHRRRTEPFTIEPSRLRFTRRAEYSEVWISFFEANE